MVNIMSTITTECDFKLVNKLSAPGNLAVSQLTSNSVKLNWTPESGAIGISGYQIFRDGVKIGESTAAEYLDGSVSASTYYAYQVRAFNGAGEFSGLSNTLGVNTPGGVDTESPSAVDSLVVSGVSSGSSRTLKVAFKWNPSTDNTGIKAYEIWRNGIKISSTQLLTYTDQNVSTYTAYDYSVKVVDIAGNYSSPGNHIIVKLSSYRDYGQADLKSPTAPQTLTGNLYDYNHIRLIWKAATDNKGVYGYEIWQNGTRISRTSSLSYTTESLHEGSKFTYYVLAYDAAGNKSAASNMVTLTVPNT